MDAFLEVLSIAGSVIFVFVALGFCIFSHELGHFLAAKMLGLHIDAFALGFKPFWRKKYKGVEYRLGYLPFGGYVELPQIDNSDAAPKAADGTPLPKAKPHEKVITAVAGPLFNIISGLLIGCIVWIWGMPQDTPKMREISVAGIIVDSPEYQAGLRVGDVITELNGRSFNLTWSKFVEQILYTTGKVTLTVKRDGKSFKVSYLPKENPNAPGRIRREKIAYPFFSPLVPLKIFPEPGSVAEKAGLKAGDIVVAVAGVPIVGYRQLQMAINMSCGEELTMTVDRSGKRVDIKVVPQPVPGIDEPPVYLIGINMTTHENKVMAASVVAGSPVSDAGIKRGDFLLKAENVLIKEPQDLQKFVADKGDKSFSITVLRDGKEIIFSGIKARKFVHSTIGISMAVYDHPTPCQQFVDTLNMSWQALRGIATGIGNKLGLTENTSSLKPSHMSGPLGIGMVLFSSVRTSPMIGIYMIVIISFALAIFNLMPFPVLDGGHIFFGIIEMIIRRPLPEMFMKILSYTFVTLLITLMVFVTFFDGRRLFYNVFGEKSVSTQNDTPSNP